MIGRLEATRTTAPTVPGLKDQSSVSDSASDDGAVKNRATLTAKLALLGFTLHELSDGAFLVCRWDRSRRLADLTAVADFLRHAAGGVA